MTIDLTFIIQAIIALLGAFVTYRIAPYLKAHTSESQYTLMMSLLYGFVKAAENLYKQGRVTDKLQWVRERMIAHGYDIDVATIETAVADLFPHETKPPAD